MDECIHNGTLSLYQSALSSEVLVIDLWAGVTEAG